MHFVQPEKRSFLDTKSSMYNKFILIVLHIFISNESETYRRPNGSNFAYVG